MIPSVFYVAAVAMLVAAFVGVWGWDRLEKRRSSLARSREELRTPW